MGSRMALLIIPHLSRPAAVRLSKFLGGAAYRLSGHLRRVGEANLDLAFGSDRSGAEKKAILKESFQTFALALVDLFWFARHHQERIRRYVAFDPVADHLIEKKARICVTAHMGNWEAMGMAATPRGFPLVSVAAPLTNPKLDRLFVGIRQVSGQQVLPKQGALRGLLSTLRKGGNVGVLLDQNTKPSEGGIFVDFFGLPVPVSGAPASLALRTGAEVVFGFSLPRPDGTYCVEVPHRFTPARQPGEDMESAVNRVTQDITRVTEGEIRKQPGLWLWMYKRWKHVAPGAPRERYPFYAKTLPPLLSPQQ
jgi:Kdo2-lipid IVA lauroyltransferase/acyltransferase